LRILEVALLLLDSLEKGVAALVEWGIEKLDGGAVADLEVEDVKDLDCRLCELAGSA
jgi:hypothetical protein